MGGWIQKNLQNNSQHKKNKCFPWATAVRVLSLTGSHCPPHLSRMPYNTVQISGPVVGAAQILIWSYSSVFLSPMSTAIRTSVFSFVGVLTMTFYIVHRHKVCLVDHVDLICSFYSWWEGLGSSSLFTLPLCFNCGFIFISACESSTGVCSWGCPGGLGFAPVRVRCGGGAAPRVAGVLVAPCTQGSWWLGQQELQCYRRVWQPVLANTSSILAWRTSLHPDREVWQDSLQGCKELDTT